MKIELWLVGKSMPYVDAPVERYEKRIHRYIPFETVIIPDIKGKQLNSDQLKQAEGDGILKRLQPTDHLILLDENGQHFSSVKFARHLNSFMLSGTKRVVFLVGGAYGFSDAVYNRANEKLSLSKMTFSHQIIRILFMEQLYRGFTIINNEPYHHA